MTVTRRRAPIPLRNRLAWTVVLVLIALGGAGLTTAADRPATDLGRPELTAHADALARPWLAPLVVQARAAAAAAGAVNESARQILSLESGADPDRLDGAISTGDESRAQLDEALAALVDQRARVPAGLDPRRMGLANRQLLAAVDGVADGAAPVSATWRALAADASQVAALLVALTDHADIDARATAAGGNGDWPAALDLLEQGAAALDVARGARDQLATTNDVSILNDLLRSYADYDSALAGLYGAVRDGAQQDSQRVRDLAQVVIAARQRLPADEPALREFVSGLAGAVIADEVVDLEAARGTVDEAVSNLP
jgi:hypothetical protein